MGSVGDAAKARIFSGFLCIIREAYLKLIETVIKIHIAVANGAKSKALFVLKLYRA